MKVTIPLLSIVFFGIPSFAAPLSERGLEQASSAQLKDYPIAIVKREAEPKEDADDAIAYAWFNEGEAKAKREAEPKEDADDAIAYAWFNEDAAKSKREAKPKEDADDAIAYAWFNEDES